MNLMVAKLFKYVSLYGKPLRQLLMVVGNSVPVLAFGGELLNLGVKYLWLLGLGLCVWGGNKTKKRQCFSSLAELSQEGERERERERKKKVGDSPCLSSHLGVDCTILV